MSTHLSRRDFLKSTSSSLTLIAVAPMLGPSTMANAASNDAVPGFNGGKWQIQSPVLLANAGLDYPFINVLKTGQEWSNKNDNNQVDPTVLDENGYPTSVQPGGYYGVCFIPSSDPTSGRPGNYVCRWDGNGAVNALGKLVRGSLSSSTGRGRYVFTPNTTRLLPGAFSTRPYPNHIRNMAVMHIDDEPAYLSGQIFGTRFKQLLIQGRPGVIRFLDWQYNNIGSLTNWETRKPQGYFSYNATEIRKLDGTTNGGLNGYWCGKTTHNVATGNNATDYAINGNGFGISTVGGPADRQTIQVYFDATNVTPSSLVALSPGSPTVVWNAGIHNLKIGDPITFNTSGIQQALANGRRLYDGLIFFVVATPSATTFQFSDTRGGPTISVASDALQNGTVTALRVPTLTLNGSAKAPLMGQDGRVFATGTIDPTRYATLVYDARLARWLKFGAHRYNSKGIDGGVPPELCMKLCAEVGAHPHFVGPYLACEATVNWHTQLAAMVKTTGPSWMIPRFEGPNECWNTATPVTQYGILWQTTIWNYSGNGASSSPGTDNWYGRYLSIMGKQIADVYAGGKGTKWDILCGVKQSAFADAARQNARLTNARTDTFQAVVIATDGVHPTVSRRDGGPHGLKNGDIVSFATSSNTLQGSTTLDTPYIVLNATSTKFDYATFAAPTTPISSSTAGFIINLYNNIPGTEAYNYATAVCPACYINPIDQGKLQEFRDALSFAINPAQFDLVTRYTNNNNVSVNVIGTIAGSILTVISIDIPGGKIFAGTIPTGPGIPYGTKIAPFGTGGTTGKGGAGTYSLSNFVPTIASPTPLVIHGLLPTYVAYQAWGASMPVPVSKLCCYEGGWSPDYAFNATSCFSSVTAISRATQAVVTCSASNVFAGGTSTPTPGNPAVVGAYMTFAGLAAPYDVYNKVISQIVAVNGNDVTIALDTSAQANSYSGKGFAGYVQDSLGRVTAFMIVNNYRRASKTVPNLANIIRQNYLDVVSVPGGEFPSCYDMAGSNVWGVWDPDIYVATTPPQWLGITQFNN